MEERICERDHSGAVASYDTLPGNEVRCSQTHTGRTALLVLLRPRQHSIGYMVDGFYHTGRMAAEQCMLTLTRFIKK